MVHRSKVSVDISPGACIAAAVILLLVPFQWVGAWLIAAFAHEYCHILALLICRNNIEEICIGANGARIQASSMKPWKLLFCTLAGPLGALLLLLLRGFFPRLAICAFIHSVYNLLPLLPLDGGHALQCVLAMVFSESVAIKLMEWEEIILINAMLLFSILAAIIFGLGLVPVIFVICLLLKVKKIKIPCKSMPHRVQ